MTPSRRITSSDLRAIRDAEGTASIGGPLLGDVADEWDRKDARIAELEEALRFSEEQWDAACAELETHCETCPRIQALRGKLRLAEKCMHGWGLHATWCNCLNPRFPATDCTCGYDAALSAFRAAEPKEGA